MAGTASAPRRVLFLVWRDTSHPEGGGSEVYVEHMAHHLASLGHDVTILCAAHGAASDELVDGVRFVRRGGRLSVYLHGLAYTAGRGRSAYAVVDVQNGIPFFTPLVRRRRRITVLVHHVHREQWQIVYPGWRGRVGWWLESRVAPRLYRGRDYVTVSRASAEELARVGVEPAAITVVHNGVDAPTSTAPSARATYPALCVLSRLVPHKRIEHAIDVVAALAEDLPDLHLDVIGDGWWHDQLTAHARRRGVDGRVTFHGHVSAQERDGLLDRSWVMLAPSVKEGWGLSIIEAAAHGVPTVAYASAGGVRESVLDNVTGHLVDDLDGLVEAARHLLTDPDLRRQMSRAARQHALDYDWDSSATAFAKQILPE